MDMLNNQFFSLYTVVLTKGDRIVLVSLAVGSGALLAALAGDLSAALTAGAVARAGHGGAVGAAFIVDTKLIRVAATTIAKADAVVLPAASASARLPLGAVPVLAAPVPLAALASVLVAALTAGAVIVPAALGAKG